MQRDVIQLIYQAFFHAPLQTISTETVERASAFVIRLYMHCMYNRITKGVVISRNAGEMDIDRPFTSLGRFGISFLSIDTLRFEICEVDSSILNDINFVDTPVIISGEKQKMDPGYSFDRVVSWFVERADRILLLFDGNKLDISDELKWVIEILKKQEDKIRIVLNKADMIDSQQLMRVYGEFMRSLGSREEILVRRRDGLSESGEEDFVIPDDRSVSADRGTHRNINKPENCPKSKFSWWTWTDKHDTAIAPHSMHRSRQCGCRIQAYEPEKIITFDYMYRAQPDVVFLDSIPTPSELNLSLGEVAISAVQVQWTAPFVKWWAVSRGVDPGQVGSDADHFIAAHRADMYIALGAVSAVDQCQFYEVSLDRNPKSYQLYCLLTHGISVKTVNILLVHIREGRGAECFRVRVLYL